MARRQWLWLGCGVALIAAAGVWWWHGHQVAAAATADPGIQSAPVLRSTVVSTMSQTGTVQAWSETVVRTGPDVSGTLEPFAWNVSQRVQAGEVLFRLVNPQLIAQIGADRTNLAVAESQLQQMEASNADTAAQQAALTNARMQAAAAAAAVTQAEANLSAGQQVTAPESGVVAAVDVTPGQSVGVGDAVATIVKTGVLTAEVNVPQTAIGNLAAGAPADVYADGGNQAGQVISVSPTADTTFKGVAAYQVDITLDNPGGWLPGMPAVAAIEDGGTWNQGFVGQLAPAATVAAVTQGAGTVATVLVQAGQAVGAGQPIARIDTPALTTDVTSAQQQAQQASGAVAALKAQQAAAAISEPFTITQARLKVQALQATLSADEAEAAGLTVRSPVSGVISGVEAVAGQPVGPGTPLLTIGDYSKVLVSFPLDQLYVNQIHVGQAGTVTATAAPGRTFPAKVYLVAPEGTNVNGVATFQAEVLLDRPTGALRPGMAAEVSIVLGTAKDALTVPLQALHTASSGGSFVVVVGAGGALLRVPVKVGLTDTLDAAIRGAVHSGMRVLTTSLSALSRTGALNLRGRVLRRRPTVTHRAPPVKGG